MDLITGEILCVNCITVSCGITNRIGIFVHKEAVKTQEVIFRLPFFFYK